MTWQQSSGCAGLNHHTSLLNKSWRIAPLRRKRPSERKSLERLHEKLASSCERTKGRSIRSDVASLIGWSEGLSGHWVRLCERSHTTGPACYAFYSTVSSAWGDQHRSSDCTDEVILARKGAKSRRSITGLRSKTTKARSHVNRVRAANADLKRKLAEALEQQTATSEVLRVIAGTPEDSRRALNTIAETAARMFDAAGVNFRRIEGDVLRVVGAAGPTMARVWEALPDLPLEPTDLAVRSVLDNRQISIEDRRAALANERGEVARVLRDLPVRSQAFTPLSRQGKAIGVMIVARGEVRPFQPGELDLMRGFADQAVIAIENARLLKELRQRTDDLSESLEQQTATSEVLRVISSSAGELKPVFETMLANATRLSEAKFGTLLLSEGDSLRMVAMHNVPPAFAEKRRREPVIRPHPETALARVARTKQVVQIADARAGPYSSDLVDLAGARTILGVPMLKDEELVGAIGIYRQEVRPFTDKQIALVRNFAH